MTVPEIPTVGFDPVRWAEAAGILSRNPAFWAFWTLIALFVVMKWGPWRKRE